MDQSLYRIRPTDFRICTDGVFMSEYLNAADLPFNLTDIISNTTGVPSEFLSQIDDNFISDIARDSLGNYFVLTRYSDSRNDPEFMMPWMAFESYEPNILLVAVNSDGSIRFTKSFGESREEGNSLGGMSRSNGSHNISISQDGSLGFCSILRTEPEPLRRSTESAPMSGARPMAEPCPRYQLVLSSSRSMSHRQ